RGFEPPAPCSQSRCATRLRHTPSAGRVSSSARAPTILLAEKPPGGFQRQAAMTHGRLLPVRELGERSAERRIEEDWIVAEATATPRRFGDHALGHTLHDPRRARRPRERNHAAEARGPPRGRHGAEPLEQELEAPPIVKARAAEARRVQSGRAAERVHLEPGVVAERQGTRLLRGGA